MPNAKITAALLFSLTPAVAACSGGTGTSDFTAIEFSDLENWGEGLDDFGSGGGGGAGEAGLVDRARSSTTGMSCCPGCSCTVVG